jgi:hypothetical protein
MLVPDKEVREEDRAQRFCSGIMPVPDKEVRDADRALCVHHGRKSNVKNSWKPEELNVA